MEKQTALERFRAFWTEIEKTLTKPPFSTVIILYCTEIFLGGSVLNPNKEYTSTSDVDLFFLFPHIRLSEEIPYEVSFVLNWLHDTSERYQLPLHISIVNQKLSTEVTESLLIKN